MTYTALEKLPGRFLRSLVEIQSKSFGNLSKYSRVKDLVENMESTTLTVLPRLSISGSKPLSTTDRYEQINANQGSLILSGGAVFKHDQNDWEIRNEADDLLHLIERGKQGVC